MTGNAIAATARSLVVEPGDRLRAEGGLIRGPEDSYWIDLTQVSMLTFNHTPWTSSYAFRLLGVDADSVPVPDGPDPSLMPNHLGIVGRWRDGAITVEEQWAAPWPRPEPRRPYLSIPPPPGGWDVENESEDLAGLAGLRASGAIVADAWLRDESGALLLRVAAADVAAVEAVLAPQLPRRLCLVRSRYTTAHLSEVRRMFDAHHSNWEFSIWGSHGLDEQCQPYAHATLTRVSADLASWADTLPDGLLRLAPRMTPPGCPEARSGFVIRATGA